MGNKDSRSGGKYTGNHTTLCPAAAILADIANESDSVAKISPGYLKAGLSTVNGQRRVKISREGVHLLLQVRDNASQQEVHVYAISNDKAQSAMLCIAKGARNAGLHISFGKNTG